MQIEAKKVEFAYGAMPVLRGLSVDAKSGEMLGIIGPNGSGKSTILKCIDGILRPQKGFIFIGGRDAAAIPREEMGRLVAFVPQTAPLDFEFSVEEVVFMGRTPHIGRFSGETARDRRAVREALEETNTAALSSRKFNELSGGERQRVLIARALAQEPRVLLLDEPTAHLDIGTQFEVMDLVKRLRAQEKMTVVGVFHDLNLAAQYCDRLALLDNGAVASSGAPADVLTHAKILQVYGMNILAESHPLTGAPTVTPYYRAKKSSAGAGARVHVICGGGSGAPLLGALIEHGFALSAGAVSVLDTDCKVAAALGLEVATESPFTHIADETKSANAALAQNADVVVLADFPVGPGNLGNIETALEAARAGKNVIVVDTTPAQKRDFTGGKLPPMLGELMRWAKRAGSIDEAVEFALRFALEKEKGRA